ncbi:MAG TPA: TIGR03000 domain-containing protein [Gemmataceae bacterium]|nr:TIGR03000 domain-containing protein [Gemmataceae bacterium]
MFKRGFSLTACAALALLLTASAACQAQVFFWPGLSYPVGPTYYPNYARPFFYNPPPTYTGYQQYTYTGPVTMYYGAATPMYYGGYNGSAFGAGPVRTTNIGAVSYETSSYPIQSPNYIMRYPVSPPLSVVTDNTAQVEVRLPAAAEVWFEGQKTTQTGTDRLFRSPDLEPGQDYVYSVRAHWEADGKAMDQTRKVTVHAGDHVVVSFPQPEK